MSGESAVAAVMGRYCEAWNRHDIEAILALHTEDTVFENHTSGGLAVGKAELRSMLQGIFAALPDLRFSTRRAYFREDVAVIEWTATATHATAHKSLSWDGMDVIPLRGGLVARKDVYADSMSYQRQLASFSSS
jgi:steroid delta-isomerase-like uncharacterized protein